MAKMKWIASSSGDTHLKELRAIERGHEWKKEGICKFDENDKKRECKWKNVNGKEKKEMSVW